MLYRLMKSLKIAIIFGFVAALNILMRPLILSAGKPVDWPPVLATAGRAFAIYAAVMFVLVGTGILKPRPKRGQSANVNPWVWLIIAGGAVAVAAWALS